MKAFVDYVKRGVIIYVNEGLSEYEAKKRTYDILKISIGRFNVPRIWFDYLKILFEL